MFLSRLGDSEENVRAGAKWSLHHSSYPPPTPHPHPRCAQVLGSESDPGNKETQALLSTDTFPASVLGAGNYLRESCLESLSLDDQPLD